MALRYKNTSTKCFVHKGDKDMTTQHCIRLIFLLVNQVHRFNHKQTVGTNCQNKREKEVEVERVRERGGREIQREKGGREKE